MKSPLAMHVLRIAIALVPVLLLARPAAAQPPPPAPSSAVDVLIHGPVHEAFAQPITLDAVATLTVPEAPPSPVLELPPPERPRRRDVRWIPGYWGWDAADEDFVWVSGTWRIAPPGRRWLPGHWSQGREGYRWVPGAWLPARQRELVHLPYPPEVSNRDQRRPPRPSPDHFWVPGNWVWRDGDFSWKRGFWSPSESDWVWVPSHYNWTPRGSLFVQGYWDYRLQDRGLLFAPVVFRPDQLDQPDFVYSPQVVISSSRLPSFLFAWPRYAHYYFGDYYAARYADEGIYPWFVFHRQGYGYDPIFIYYTHRYGDRAWLDRYERWYRYLRENEAARPPRTFAQQRRWADRQGRDLESIVLGTVLDQLVGSRRAGFTFESLDAARRQEVARGAADIRRLTERRQQAQADVGDQAQPGAQPEAARRQEVLRIPLPEAPPPDEPAAPAEARPAQESPPPAIESDEQRGRRDRPGPRRPRPSREPRGRTPPATPAPAEPEQPAEQPDEPAEPPAEPAEPADEVEPAEPPLPAEPADEAEEPDQPAEPEPADEPESADEPEPADEADSADEPAQSQEPAEPEPSAADAESEEPSEEPSEPEPGAKEPGDSPSPSEADDESDEEDAGGGAP